MTAFHGLENHDYRVKIAQKGGEITSLRYKGGPELIWPARPAWPRHAPNLFPIVGRLKNNILRHQGQDYPLTQHGFARDLNFNWEQHNADSCRLYLSDNDDTCLHYPFAFRFELSYALNDAGLSANFTVINTGDTILPAALGAHPGFQWPLFRDDDKADYYLEFEHHEDDKAFRLKNDFLSPQAHASPVRDKTLPLDENLFIDDVLIFKNLRSRSVLFRTEKQKIIAVGWDDGFPHLGLWSKPGSGFLCIEPWQGLPGPLDFDGEISAKPDMLLLKPGEKYQACYCITAFG